MKTYKVTFKDEQDEQDMIFPGESIAELVELLKNDWEIESVVKIEEVA
jgi:hypothetical protein